jgi:histidine triad (HIT) family protein
MVCELCDAIAAGETIIFEDDDVVAFLDTNAATMAHITITPKKHYPTMDEVPDYLVAWCFAISNKLSKILLESLNIQGLNLLVESREGAGQPYPHFSINLIPRIQNDSLPLIWTPSKVEFSDLQQIQGVYKKATGSKWVFEQKVARQKPAEKKQEVIKEDGGANYQIRHWRRVP